ncbi:hypothetical protein V6255_17985 [Psychromonas arctica]|uniref:Uncharacterized protein n=1 Tax=Psychromonas arctica TaxID=168275 RepID=A0ABU9HGM5_9GAMM
MKNTSQITIPYINNAIIKLRYLAEKNLMKVTIELKLQKILNVSRRLVNEWVKIIYRVGLILWH